MHGVHGKGGGVLCCLLLDTSLRLPCIPRVTSSTLEPPARGKSHGKAPTGSGWQNNYNPSEFQIHTQPPLEPEECSNQVLIIGTRLHQFCSCSEFTDRRDHVHVSLEIHLESWHRVQLWTKHHRSHGKTLIPSVKDNPARR
jgi:hypothetical protein